MIAAPAYAAAPDAPASPGASVAPPPIVIPENKAARLDELFAELKDAPTPAEGRQVAQLIILEWLSSGDDEIDTLMAGAMVAMEIRAFKSAISILDKVVAAKPDYVEGWNKRATVYYYLHQYDRSMSDIERTLALDPRHFGALAGLGMIMQDTGNMPGAIAAFEKAVEVNPTLDNLRLAIEQLKARVGKDI
jgi:tetratricopeptide (TPR) repeat protein